MPNVKWNRILVPLTLLLALIVFVAGWQIMKWKGKTLQAKRVSVIAPLDDTVRNAWRIGDTRIAVLTNSLTLSLWDSTSLSKPALLRTTKCPVSDPRLICVISETKVAWARYYDQGERFEIVDWESGAVLFSYAKRYKEGRTTALAANDGRGLVAWIEDGCLLPLKGQEKLARFALRIADLKTGGLVLDLEVPKKNRFVGSFAALALAPDCSAAAFGTDSGESAVGAASLASKTVLWHQPAAEYAPYAIAYASDGGSFFTSTVSGYVVRYAAGTGNVDAKCGPLSFSTDGGLPGLSPVEEKARLLAMDVSPNGKYLAVDTEGSLGVVIFDTTTGKELRRINASKWPIEHALIFSADSRHIWAAGSADRELSCFEVTDPK